MSILIGLFTVILVVVCLLLVLLVLMQRPRQEGLGAALGGDTMSTLVGGDTTNVLQKGTVYLAVIFFVAAILLSVFVTAKQASEKKGSAALEQLKNEQQTKVAPLANESSTNESEAAVPPNAEQSEAADVDANAQGSGDTQEQDQAQSAADGAQGPEASTTVEETAPEVAPAPGESVESNEQVEQTPATDTERPE